MTGPARDPFRILEVHVEARPEVVEAAFRVLREITCADDSDAAVRRLADLNWAHRVLTTPDLRARLAATGRDPLAQPPSGE